MNKPHVALQMAPHNFYDEGIDHVLDTLQRLGGVEEVFVYSQVLHDSWGQHDPARYPDHGGPRPTGARPDMSRVWHHPDPEFYRGLPVTLTQDPAQPYGDRDIFEDLREPAERRGMKVSAFLLEPGFGRPPVPGWGRVLSVDCHGRRGPMPCARNPYLRGWWLAQIEDLFVNHPHLDGLLFGQERGAPLSNQLSDHAGNLRPPTCFCPHCEEHGARQGVNVERARRGMQELLAWTNELRDTDRQPGDGAFTEMIRLFLEYPEILAWTRLFQDALESQRHEIYGLVHAIHPRRHRVGWHIETNSSFDPFRRAENDLRRYRHTADFIKIVVYSNANGYRAREWFWHRGALRTWLRDLPEDLAITVLYHLLGYDPAVEPDAAALRAEPVRGFTADYVERETRRAVRRADPVPIYAGVGIDIPPGPPLGTPTTRESAYADTTAALRGGASGILISRDYTEMQLTGLEGVGCAVRDWAG